VKSVRYTWIFGWWSFLGLPLDKCLLDERKGVGRDTLDHC
jgi:hypothetical protein